MQCPPKGGAVSWQSDKQLWGHQATGSILVLFLFIGWAHLDVLNLEIHKSDLICKVKCDVVDHRPVRTKERRSLDLISVSIYILSFFSHFNAESPILGFQGRQQMKAEGDIKSLKYKYFSPLCGVTASSL